MSGPGTIDIGTLQQDQSIPAYINVDDMVRKHFAVFGTTGVGKSSGVALLLRQILDARPDLRMFLIDPHNEYGHCFDDRAQVLSPKNLKLPFWVFNFEEIVDVFFRGRPGVDEEVEILSELVPIAKSIFTPNNGPAARRIVRNDPKILRLHGRHAGAVPAGGPDPPDRRAHGQAGEPLRLGDAITG